MAYIMVTTDNRTVVFIKHHTEYPMEDEKAVAKLLNDLSGAVLAAAIHHEKLEERYQAFLDEIDCENCGVIANEKVCKDCRYFVAGRHIGGDCRYSPPTPSVLSSGTTYPKVGRDSESCDNFERREGCQAQDTNNSTMDEDEVDG